MKKGFYVLLLMMFAKSAFAGDVADNALGLYDFAAPAAYQTADVVGQTLGAIVFQTKDSTFQGYTGNGTWTQLSPPSGGHNVISEGVERVERTRITNNGSVCAISSQSGSWLSGVSFVGTGECTLSINAGVFSATPVCTAISDGGAYAVVLNSITSTSVAMETINTTNGMLANGNYSIICMGPQ